jgi:hypothetical protein
MSTSIQKLISLHLALHYQLHKFKLLITILHKCSALIMLIAIAGTTFSKAIALVDYQLNKNYIASALCENRGKPLCCCRGKCFLKKQLQKDEDASKNNLPVSKDKIDVSLFCETVSRNYFNDQVAQKIFFDRYLLKKYSAALTPVFHPPGNL